MSESSEQPSSGPQSSGDEAARHSALFAQLVMQQANMALMFMGHSPEGNDQSVPKDLQTASFFIDLLEMLDVKTKGNLARNEADVLRQSLMSLRMAFVEASEADKTGSSQSNAPQPAAPQATATDQQQSPSQSAGTPSGSTSSETEDRRKFSKKY